MQGIIFTFSTATGSCISDEIISQIASILGHVPGVNSEDLKVVQLDESSFTAAVICGTTHVVADVSKSAFPLLTVEDVQASITFLQENFGDPLDGESNFRARFNKAYYAYSINHVTRSRIDTCVKMFATLHNKKLTKDLTSLLKRTGFAFLPEYAASIIRFSEM